MQHRSLDAFGDREHVVPEAFGKFLNNFTLTCVCSSCNKYFGETIDLTLARDSPEGMDRFLKGGKDPGAYKSLGRRATISYTIKEGPTAGIAVTARPGHTSTGIELVPDPSIGIAEEEDGPFQWFAPSEIPEAADLASTEPGAKRYLRLVHISPEEAEPILVGKGYRVESFGEGYDIDFGQEVAAELHAFAGRQHFRCLAKIAMNYLAHQYGPGTALMPQFNVVRAYVRHGDEPQKKITWMDRTPILPVQFHPLDAVHVVRVAWRSGLGVMAQLSLHGAFRYSILLAGDEFALVSAIRSVHLFDTRTKKIVPLPAYADIEFTTAASAPPT